MKNSLFTLLPLAAVLTVGTANAKDFIAPQAPKDPGVINKERIQYWMEKRGEITKSMSIAEINAKVSAYAQRAHPGQLTAMPKVKLAKSQKQISSFNKQGDEQTKTVNVLSVLIDFPDLPYDDNGLSSGDTSMYYPSYPVSHYQSLQFSSDGFTGPSNQTLLSGYQYYQQESGGSFFFNGTTYGWVTADNNHAYYGGNDPENDDNDLAVGELVTEAVNKAFAANEINLADFDVEDQFDIDNDGNVNEPDGFIDHVMIYHSSIGEEAGGGVAGNNGDDAIWSHRFFVNPTDSWASRGADIEGSEYQTGQPYRVFGYTVQPIDAAAGVVVHEFGHDLGLPDEYDTDYAEHGEPVGAWSIMSGGSWTGTIPGTEPSGFSPYARDYLQTQYGGDWLDQVVINANDLTEAGQPFTISEAVNHASDNNQVKLLLPISAYSGDYVYHSGDGHNLENSMSFSLTVPEGSSAVLSMKSLWSIEEDYDYALVNINGVAITGNHTIDGPNQYHPTVENYISNSSAELEGANEFGWVDLSFDISEYTGQTVTVEFEYITDGYVGGFGILFDDIKLNVDGSAVYNDDVEGSAVVTYDGFSQSEGLTESGKHYYIQVRSYNEVDSGLQSRRYERGVVLWFANNDYSDNNVGTHPGYGFIGVVDADQNLNTVNTASTWQIRDAAFSLYEQSSFSGDNHLDNIDSFDDANDYSSPSQPQSGLVLPQLGINFEVTDQAADSSSATILLKKRNPEPAELTANFSYNRNFRTVTFTDGTSGGAEGYTYAWDFGDGEMSTQDSPTHEYAAAGEYTVTLTVTDSEGVDDSHTTTVVIAEQLTASFVQALDGATVSVESTVAGGDGTISYSWNFGDDNGTAETANASYTYTASGTYDISLTVESEDNQSTTVTQQIEIYIAPVAAFSHSVNNLTATFTNTSTGGAGDISYEWDFGDGATSTNTNVTRNYAEAGTYTVTLSMTDGEGAVSTISKQVTVTEAPKSGGGGSTGGLLIALLAGMAMVRRKR